MAKNKNFTATGQLIDPDTEARQGIIYGLHVNNHSSGTVKLIDSPSGTSGRYIFGSNANAYDLASGDGIVQFAEPLEFYEGVYVIVGGTLDADLIWEPTVTP